MKSKNSYIGTIILLVLVVFVTKGFIRKCEEPKEVDMAAQNRARLDSIKKEINGMSDTIVFNHPQLGELILPRVPFLSLDSMTAQELVRIGYFNSHYHLADTIETRCKRLGLGGYNFPTDYLKPEGIKEYNEVRKTMKEMPQREDATSQEIKLYLSMIDKLASIIRTHNTSRPLLQFYQMPPEVDTPVMINGEYTE